MSKQKYLFNLSLAQQEVVFDFAYDAARILLMQESHANCKVWLKEQAERIERQHSQECWEVCNYVFWRLVSVFGCSHSFSDYMRLDECASKNGIKRFLMKEGK